ncbi:hypothetical protein CISIN_1g034820mg [Citrus sinensis]|uniref:Uncharacterized protein n=1 Tax=Citrus sinensis TaxID=2711 RepID=A0A067GY29_CITSI|nr:hypothetical protein CISIN_1g034820mg [Citrus sinensis]
MVMCIIVMTIAFMFMAVLTITVMNHLKGMETTTTMTTTAVTWLRLHPWRVTGTMTTMTVAMIMLRLLSQVTTNICETLASYF